MPHAPCPEKPGFPPQSQESQVQEEVKGDKIMWKPQQILQGRYQLKQLLGQNAGRQTWLAVDIKLVPKEPEWKPEIENQIIVKLLAFNPQMQWEELKLFEREARVLKNINHPRIPKYRDYFSVEAEEGGGFPWFGLVQEYIPGESLKQILETGKCFTEVEVRAIARQILDILIYLHELSPPVLHRDIKPSNLILRNQYQIYLVDFGAVQDKAKAEGVTFTVVGSSGYAPPEQLWGKAVPASDLYALGATLIHLLTGKSPAELPLHQMQIYFKYQISIDPDFSDWIDKLNKPALERRFSTARQAGEVLQEIGINSSNNQEDGSSLRSYGCWGCSVIFLSSVMGVILLCFVFLLILVYSEIDEGPNIPENYDDEHSQVATPEIKIASYFIEQKSK